MSTLSEIEIELGKSTTYVRLILLAYLITFILIGYLPLEIYIKLILFSFLLLKHGWIRQNPSQSIKKIQFIGNKWILETPEYNTEPYTHAIILIHNPLFQLIEFANANHKKRIVLFLDQLTSLQLRLLHLKIRQSSI